MRSAIWSTSSACSSIVLVEQEMELVERGPGDLPVGLLVEVPQRDGVCERLIERLDALDADRLGKPDRQPRDRPVLLKLGCALAGVGLGARVGLGRVPTSGGDCTAALAVGSLNHEIPPALSWAKQGAER